MKIVIRAGGTGTRLWPLSREEKPKQFHAIVGDKTLAEETYNRVKALLQEKGDLFFSVGERFKEKIMRLIPDLPEKNVILEPASKNTGPAICLESCVIAERFSENEIIASLPSDDYISDPKAFRGLLMMTEKFLENNPEYIVTPGIKPTRPDTGYSYIKAGENLHLGGEEAIFKVADWVEKPDLDYCKELVASGIYYYHTGMYIWKVKTVLDLYRKYQPELYESCREIAVLRKSKGNEEKVREIYSALEKISVESAITDKAEKIAMSVSNRIGWSDLGKWFIIKDLLPANNGDNLTKGDVLPLDTTGCLIYGKPDKIIATIGLNNLVIVDTENALLICPKERADEVKKVVEELKNRKNSRKYL